MTMQLRPYQRDAINAVFEYWAEGGENPLVEAATGVGKSIMIAELCRELLARYPTMRILALVHVQELVAQNAEELIQLWPAAPVGINSAALGRRDKHSTILFASVQSIWRHADRIGDYDLIIIDECHLIPPKGEGMYRTLLDAMRTRVPDLRVAGFTATPYRIASGRLDEGPDRLFTKTVYAYGIGEGIRDGYLAPLIAKGTKSVLNVDGVARRGGEFIESSLQEAVDHEDLIEAAVDEMMAFGEDRHSWLVFCSGVQHADNVAKAIKQRGISCESVNGGTPKHERKQIINAFKRGEIRCLTNAVVLTTGFNAPKTDLLAFLRPTLSVSLYIQMCGRLTRPVYPAGFDANAATPAERLKAIAESSKPNGLVLDFAGNVRRHGPVDLVRGAKAKTGGGGGDMAKLCPECESYNALGARTCIDCGYEFPFAPPESKHETFADGDVAVLSSDIKKMLPQWVLVSHDVTYQRHDKPGSPSSMRVQYLGKAYKTYREWVCFEHEGYPRNKAERWWHKMGGNDPVPASVDEALERAEELCVPARLQVRQDGKFTSIVGYSFEALAEAAE